jgi:hypothetical protein
MVVLVKHAEIMIPASLGDDPRKRQVCLCLGFRVLVVGLLWGALTTRVLVSQGSSAFAPTLL